MMEKEQHIMEKESELGLIHGTSKTTTTSKPWWRPSHRVQLFILAQIFVVSLSAILITSSWQEITRIPTDHDLVVATNAWSPLLDRREMHLAETWLKSSFVNHHNTPPSIFRQPPSLDVDAAWETIHKNARNFLITEDEVRRLGKDPEYAVIAPEEWQNGEEKYFALTQVQHDLHCLNMVRMSLFPAYYFPDGKVWGAEQHFLHCLHALLQSLRCKYSTDVYLASWVEESDFPVVDFNVSRKCLNYEYDVNSWKPETQRTDAEFFGLRAPEGTKYKPASIV